MDLDSVRVYTNISTYRVFGLGKLMPEISAADDIALLIYIALSALLVFITYKVYEKSQETGNAIRITIAFIISLYLIIGTLAMIGYTLLITIAVVGFFVYSFAKA